MAYCVRYKMDSCSNVKQISIAAKNKEQAYDRAVYEEIKRKEGSLPYSAWVHSVTYNNGREKRFNTFEGKPY